MFKKLSKKLSVLILAALCMQSITVSAYQFPNTFWPINDAYMAAVDNNDSYAIIEHGLKAIALMETQPEADEVINVIGDRTQRLANVYAELGMYDKSVEMYEKFIPYGERLNWQDSIVIANANIPQYRSRVKVYTDGGNEVYFGAKNEPGNGVMFGVIGGSSTRNMIPHESAILLYHELGEEMIYDVPLKLQEASEKNLAVELALNCPNEGDDIRYFDSKKYDVENVSNMLKNYPDVKVFLRFGAEMNIWGNGVDPDQFKEAFRYVSDYFKNNNPNVAVVWSPGAVSSWGSDVNDYYPGDEYVDWVGASLYCSRYLMGNPEAVDYEEKYFKTGINANPVLIIEELVQKYGDRKPIMIAESGFGHRVNSPYTNEDTTEWALQKLKEFYNNVLMVYPQIKFVAHFDIHMPNEENDYSLVNSPELQSEYIEVTKNPRMIQYNSDNNSSLYYNEVYDGLTADGILPLYTYVHVYDDKVIDVKYYIDGGYVGAASKMPYNVNVRTQELEPGEHTVGAVITTERGNVLEREYKMNIQPAKSISVQINNETQDFNVSPVIHNGRTLVPLRAIFEALDATVEWDGDTRTVYSTKGDTEISLTIDSNLLYVNGETKTLDVTAQLVDGKTMVPARAVAEAFNCSVDWDPDNGIVHINY